MDGRSGCGGKAWAEGGCASPESLDSWVLMTDEGLPLKSLDHKRDYGR